MRTGGRGGDFPENRGGSDQRHDLDVGRVGWIPKGVERQVSGIGESGTVGFPRAVERRSAGLSDFDVRTVDRDPAATVVYAGVTMLVE